MIRKLLSFFVFFTAISSFSQVLINEVMTSNSAVYPDFQGQYQDWIELYNSSNQIVDLAGYGLSDDSNQPFQWKFPSVIIPAKGFLIVFCSSKNVEFNGELHSNFKLSASGETAYLSAPSGVLLSKIKTPSLMENQSYARTNDGQSIWAIFTSSTPKKTNVGGTLANEKVNKPIVSHEAGFFGSAQSISISCGVNETVLYSLDGNYPTLVYNQPINIATHKVLKTVCVNGEDKSEVKTNSFFIGVNHDVPVVSLSFRPDDFYSVDSGIYVLGDTFENKNPYWGANFWQDWEREVHFEYFIAGEEKLEQDVGVAIVGGWSRAQPMKSIRLIARKEYGNSRIEYPFFKEKPYLESFDQLHLRNAGNDFNQAMWVDALNHRAIAQISDIDRQSYQPVAVYFNGNYMGLHNMRERVNPEYVADNHKIDAKKIDFLELNGGVDLPTADLPLSNSLLSGQIKQGSNAHWLHLYDTLMNTPMSDELYKYAGDNIDLDLYVDYFAAETYHINWDWPHNNIRYWRSPTEFDGKWRFCYYDTEFGMGINNSTTAVTFNELSRVLNDNKSVHSLMFSKLLQHQAFKTKFINRASDFMNTIYVPANYSKIAQGLDEGIKNEILKHQAKYGNKAGRDNRVAGVYNFINARPANARSHFTTHFGNTQNSITLEVLPQGAGKIKISTIIPDTYPWNGVYYNGVPVVVTAIPNDGFVFNSWSLNNLVVSANGTTTLNLSGAITSLKANFTSTVNYSLLKITEINYNELTSVNESGDWFELYNAGNITLDLSKWMFNDGHPANKYVFPKGTSLAPSAFVVVASDLIAFKKKYPTVTNVLGGFDFSLGNGGDFIKLTDSLGQLKLSLAYSDNSPWPSLSDGRGATLELINVSLEDKNPLNWSSHCIDGSPGKATQDCSCNFSVDLGEDLVRCGVFTELLTSNLSAASKKFFWYKDGDLVSIQPTLEVNEADDYELVVHSNKCIEGDVKNIYNSLKVNLGQDLYLCTPSSFTLKTGYETTDVTSKWFKGDDEISDQSRLFVNQKGTYMVSLNAAQCLEVRDTILVNSFRPEPVNELFCEEDSMHIAKVNGGGNYQWFSQKAGGVSLGSGASYLAEHLISDTVLYVQDNTLQAYELGLGTSTSNYTSSTVGTNGMAFTVSYPLVFDAISVRRASNSGTMNVLVRILNEAGIVIFVKAQTIAGTTSLTRIPLGVNLLAGKYTIDAVGSATSGTSTLRYENSNLSFPYSISNVISITGTSSNETNRYNFFYKWEVTKGEQGCERTPLVLTSQDCIPTAINDTETNTSLSFYPNPSSSKVNFSSEVESVRLLDSKGRILLTSKNAKESINVSNLDGGLYLLELTGFGGEVKTTKLEVLR